MSTSRNKRNFTAVYKKSGKWYLAWIEEVPGVNTQGKTLKEVKENLKDALILVIEANRLLSKKDSGKGAIRESIAVSVWQDLSRSGHKASKKVMRSLRELIAEAETKEIAIGHFNVSELAAFRAVTKAARDLNVPVIIGTSEGEREFIDLHDAVSMVRDLREKHGQAVYLNADHTYSVEKVKEAVEAGYDAVIFDGVKLSLEENISKTKEVASFVKKTAPHVLVEAEIGDVGSGSKIRKEDSAAIRPEDLTTPEEATRFVKETGVDLLAPAVGNIHGALAQTNADGTLTFADAKLNIERIREIKEAAKVPLVLHGASGNTDEELRAAIQAGIAIVHISTEIRAAWRKGLEESLREQPDEVAPYKLLSEAEERIYEIVIQKLKLFNNLS